MSVQNSLSPLERKERKGEWFVLVFCVHSEVKKGDIALGFESLPAEKLYFTDRNGHEHQRCPAGLDQ